MFGQGGTDDKKITINGQDILAIKTVKLTITVDLDFTGKNGHTTVDADDNDLAFTLPEGVAEILGLSLVSNGSWINVCPWYCTTRAIKFMADSKHPSSTYAPTGAVFACYLIYR